MLPTRRAFGLSLATAGALTILPRLTKATTVRALSLQQLIEFSNRAALGTPVHYSSDYAYVGGSRRIVTWTRVVQEENLYSSEEQAEELLIMTLGGKVGSLRQKVPGEAALTMGQRCLIFTGEEAPDGTRQIVGMGQGKFTVEQSDRIEILRPSRDLPHLVRSRKAGPGGEPVPTAMEVLSGKSLSEARELLRGQK
jgi:hypothetical protein